MRSYWTNMIDVLMRREETDADVQGECHLATKTEIGMMHLHIKNTKDCWQPPEAAQDKGFYPWAFGESMALFKPWFWNSSFQDSKKVNSVVLSHPVCGTLLNKEPLETNIFTKAFFLNPHLELCEFLLHQLLERGSHTFTKGASAPSEGTLWNGNGWCLSVVEDTAICLRRNSVLVVPKL